MNASFELARLSATTVPDHSIGSLFEMYLTSHHVCAHLPFQSPPVLNEDGASEREFWVSWCICPFGSMGYIFFIFFECVFMPHKCRHLFPWIWCKILLVNITFSLCFAEMSWLFCDNLCSISMIIINQSFVCHMLPFSRIYLKWIYCCFGESFAI